MEITLKGKVAVVTGGTRGIGYAVVRKYLEAGASVALFGSRQCTADAALERITSESPGANVMALSPDLTDSASVEGAFGEVVKRFGRIDILVNNAGIIRRDDLLRFSEEDWDAVMDTNLKTLFFLSQAAARHMAQRGSGKIINIASLLSFQGGIRVPSYTASKHGVAGLTRLLANEWAGRGLNVNAIAPGYVETKATTALREDPDRAQAILDRIPAGRWGRPEDIGQTAVFLSAPASDYVNGAVLNVDGGWLAR